VPDLPERENTGLWNPILRNPGCVGGLQRKSLLDIRLEKGD
jgi:hypothetical protein